MNTREQKNLKSMMNVIATTSSIMAQMPTLDYLAQMVHKSREEMRKNKVNFLYSESDRFFETYLKTYAALKNASEELDLKMDNKVSSNDLIRRSNYA